MSTASRMTSRIRRCRWVRPAASTAPSGKSRTTAGCAAPAAPARRRRARALARTSPAARPCRHDLSFSPPACRGSAPARCSGPCSVRDRQVSDRDRQFSNICSNDTPVTRRFCRTPGVQSRTEVRSNLCSMSWWLDREARDDRRSGAAAGARPPGWSRRLPGGRRPHAGRRGRARRAAAAARSAGSVSASVVVPAAPVEPGIGREHRPADPAARRRHPAARRFTAPPRAASCPAGADVASVASVAAATGVVEAIVGAGRGSGRDAAGADPGVVSRPVGARVVRPAPGHLRLTRRGRLVTAAALLLIAVLTLVGVVSRAGSLRESAPVPASAPAQVVVAPGETLWSIAERVAPHRDPRTVVAGIRGSTTCPPPTSAPARPCGCERPDDRPSPRSRRTRRARVRPGRLHPPRAVRRRDREGPAPPPRRRPQGDPPPPSRASKPTT